MDKDILSENIEQQLFELEMLEAMFPGEGELQMEDECTHTDVRMWLKAATNSRSVDFLPPRISFKICLKFDDTKDKNSKEVVDVNVLYPHQYPSSEKVEIYIKSRNDALNRTQQCKLNESLSLYLNENVILGEVCLISVISWLNENCPKYIESSKKDGAIKPIPKGKDAKSGSSSNAFIRLWIYSHHIYSKTKRRDIIDLSSEYQLSGFSMPGKPGIICLEGEENNCNEAWSVIKSWNWKKINVKHEEKTQLNNEIGDIDSFHALRRFKGFEEIGFIKDSVTRDYHMDMGEFSKYLDQHSCLYMFKLLFGFDK